VVPLFALGFETYNYKSLNIEPAEYAFELKLVVIAQKIFRCNHLSLIIFRDMSKIAST